MPNPFFNAMGGGQPNIMQMLQQLRANPAQFLAQSKFKIPQNLINDPNAIVQHLLSSGQVNQQQINAVYQMAQRFK